MSCCSRVPPPQLPVGCCLIGEEPPCQKRQVRVLPLLSTPCCLCVASTSFSPSRLPLHRCRPTQPGLTAENAATALSALLPLSVPCCHHHHPFSLQVQTHQNRKDKRASFHCQGLAAFALGLLHHPCSPTTHFRLPLLNCRPANMRGNAAAAAGILGLPHPSHPLQAAASASQEGPLRNASSHHDLVNGARQALVQSQFHPIQPR